VDALVFENKWSEDPERARAQVLSQYLAEIDDCLEVGEIECARKIIATMQNVLKRYLISS